MSAVLVGNARTACIMTTTSIAYGKTTIVYLGRGGTSEQASYTKLIEEFEALHPDIDVEIN